VLPGGYIRCNKGRLRDERGGGKGEQLLAALTRDYDGRAQHVCQTGRAERSGGSVPVEGGRFYEGEGSAEAARVGRERGRLMLGKEPTREAAGRKNQGVKP